MEGQVIIPSRIIEWLSMTVGGTPNWGASIDGLNKWFLSQWRSTKDNISHNGFKQLKLENIKLVFEQHGRPDLYQALTQYFSNKGQINDIKGDNYISEESFLNLEDKFKAYIGSSDQSDEEVDMEEGDMEEECSEMFANHDEKFSFYTDQISVYLDGSYTQGTHTQLKSMLKEIQTALNICKSKGVNVEKKIQRFNDLNQRYKSWCGQSKAKKSKPKSKSKSANQPRNFCSEEENWYRNFNDNIFAIQASMRKPCNDTNQGIVENRMNDLKNSIVRCRDDLPQDGVVDRIFTFNELYYEYEHWLGGRESGKRNLKQIIAPGMYYCNPVSGLCIPTGNREGAQTAADCKSTCKKAGQDEDGLLPDVFYDRDGNLLSAGDLFGSFGLTQKPTKKQILTILKGLYPGTRPGEIMNKLGAQRFFECRQELYGAMKKKKPNSKRSGKKEKRSGKKEKRSGKKRKPSRTRRR